MFVQYLCPAFFAHPYNEAARHPAEETSMRVLIAEDDQVLADGLLRSQIGRAHV